MKYRWYQIKKYIFPTLSFGICLLAALFWVALRVNHAGISKFLGADTDPSFLIMNLPVMVCAGAWVAVAVALWGLVNWERRKWPAVLAFLLGLVFTVGSFVVIWFGARDYLRFIIPHFLDSVAVAGAILGFALLLYFPIRGRNGLKAALVAAVIAFAVIAGYQLKPCTFTYGAVVYAVEDEYQIVFSTSDSAVAWVEVGGQRYYDLYAGSMRSADKVHKVTVPQRVLDGAGGYTVCAKQMIYRGPFGGYTGPTIAKAYEFRPVDASDGLEYFAAGDVHEAVQAAADASQVSYDFVVLLGDLVSMVETEKDAQLANQLAHAITGGQVPVIYVRGNHEIKGEYAEVLYKYVGSKNQEYAYTVTLSDQVFAVVLDMGEDHEDDWWEYYGTAQFDLYRSGQTQMLEDILRAGEYEKYPYRMALCHIPVVYGNGKYAQFREEWTGLLNQMELDMYLGGHNHELLPFIPGQVEPYAPLTLRNGTVRTDLYLTDFDFPGFLVGRRSLVQEGGTQKNGYDQYTGLWVQADLTQGVQRASYINSLHQTLECRYPFAEGTFETVTLDLRSRK